MLRVKESLRLVGWLVGRWSGSICSGIRFNLVVKGDGCRITYAIVKKDEINGMGETRLKLNV